MGKIFINATKNYGEKISTIFKNSSERVDGIYYSLADVPQNQLEGLNSLSNVNFILKEFPLYYLVNDNVYYLCAIIIENRALLILKYERVNEYDWI